VQEEKGSEKTKIEVRDQSIHPRGINQRIIETEIEIQTEGNQKQ